MANNIEKHIIHYQTGRQPRARLKTALFWAALVALAVLMLSGVFLSRFSRDESQWIYTTRYFALLRPSSMAASEWNSYWTHTQPPLARYVMGASLEGAGFDLFKLNGPWDFTKEDSENDILGNMPTPAMLFWARLPMAIVAAVAVVIIGLIGNRLGGPVAGIGAAAWLALNPRTRELMTRAEADGLLACLMLLSLWLLMLLVVAYERAEPVRRVDARIPRLLLLTVLTGVVLGLAASAKLTGILGLVALAFVLPIESVVLWLHDTNLPGLPNPQRLQSLLKRLAVASGIIAGCAGMALLVFVLLNPALYNDPVANTQALFSYRQTEMQAQMALYPSAALAEGLPRLQAALVRPLFTYSLGAGLLEGVAGKDGRALGELLPVDALLAATGIGAALLAFMRTSNRKYRVLRIPHSLNRRTTHYSLLTTEPISPFVRTEGDVRTEGKGLRTEAGATEETVRNTKYEIRNTSPSVLTKGEIGVALVFTAVYFFGIALNMGLDWDRYTLPLSVLSALWVGVGIGTSAECRVLSAE